MCTEGQPFWSALVDRYTGCSITLLMFPNLVFQGTRMIKKTTKYFATLALTMGVAPITMAADYEIDLSLETGPNHIRNISIKEWVADVEEATNGRLKVNVYDGASKFKGSSVPAALAQGTLDMGIPGTWNMTKFIPEFGIIFTPVFFGGNPESMYNVMDGPVGQKLINLTEDKLDVKVIGRFIDIGSSITFTKDQPIEGPDDYSGKRIRIAGSVAHARRYNALGATAVKISWPDVPQSLQTGMIEGVMTAFESVRSVKLWDSGIKYAYVDNQSFHQYVPMINRRVWNNLPSDIQSAILTTWDNTVDWQRSFAARRNEEAVKVCEANGISVTYATDSDLKLMRNKLAVKQDEIVEELGIAKEFSDEVKAAL